MDKDIEVTTIFYDAIENFFIDTDGDPIYDIFRLISPNDLKVFKSDIRDMVVRKTDNHYIELVYPEYLNF